MMNLLFPLSSPPPEEVLWKSRYLDQLKKHILPTDDPRWGRLLCTWHEKRSDDSIVSHHYAACIDQERWGIYIDCRPRKIFVKCIAQLFLRPFHILIKTIYHLSMGPIFFEKDQSLNQSQTKSNHWKNAVKSLADIIRTPLYGIIHMIASVAALIIGMASPEQIYTERAKLGSIEEAANRGEKRTAWTLAPCFQPFPMTILEKYDYEKSLIDTHYENNDPLEMQLANFARRCIRLMRKKCDVFACEILNSQKIYISPILKLI